MKKFLYIFLVIMLVFALSGFASADDEIRVDTTWTGKITASSVNLRTTPELHAGNNVYGIVQNGEWFELQTVALVYGIDNSLTWRHVKMTTGGNINKIGYVASQFTVVYPPGHIEP